jgi:hypothetical protein
MFGRCRDDPEGAVDDQDRAHDVKQNGDRLDQPKEGQNAEC